MREVSDAFHLAIPAADLDQMQQFYVDGLGCKLARRYADRITLDFFGDQVVCHLSDAYDRDPTPYPRHFGVTFAQRADFDRLVSLARLRALKFFAEPEPRFAGMAEEHLTVMLIDPSNNLLEFKHYVDPRMLY
ncbi:MAG: VOC family protein [Sciscionella sp.]